MEKGERTRRVLVALLAMLVVGTADAQKRRLPTRTEEIPDTESGRPAASAERPTFKGRLLIFGPPSLPVTPPPEHIKPAPPDAQATARPAPAPAPAPVIAAPAPKPEPAPAPVVTPVTPPPAPVATPIPAPPAPIAKPAPAPEPAPAPVAKPEPRPEPASSPVATPAPAVVKPAPVAAPAVREPVVRIEPGRPAPAKPAAPPTQVAIAAPSSTAVPSPVAPAPIEMRLIESIFTCLAPGLPQDWRRAWVEITDQGGGKEKVSKFRYTNLRGDDEGEPLVPCNAQELTRRIVSLNEKLPPDRRAWSRALLVIESDGEYELSYEYPR